MVKWRLVNAKLNDMANCNRYTSNSLLNVVNGLLGTFTTSMNTFEHLVLKY